MLTGVSQNEDHFSENNVITFETEKIKVIQDNPRNKKRLSAMNRVGTKIQRDQHNREMEIPIRSNRFHLKTILETLPVLIVNGLDPMLERIVVTVAQTKSIVSA